MYGPCLAIENIWPHLQVNGATVECEPWFTGSREKCELGNNVNHKM